MNNDTLSMNDKTIPYAHVQNGQLYIQHHQNGPYPTIVPCQTIKLIVNDQEVKVPIPVTMQDDVRLETVKEHKDGEWAVTISHDNLEAILSVRPATVIHRTVKDLPAAARLQLEALEQQDFFPALTLNELMQELSRLGIKHGIDVEACSHGVKSCVEEDIVIARGVPATPGKDGRVELLFSSDVKIAVQIGEEEAVDFRKKFVFTSVTSGETLAVKHLPGFGQPGTGVKGEVITPPAAKEIHLSAGEGVELTQDKKMALATRPGRPVARHSPSLVKVSVMPELVYSGDVGLASGNIAFKGDVIISGNVDEGISVEAGGNVKIGGLVSGVRIQATGTVLIRQNIVMSTVIAGGPSVHMQELLPQLKIISSDLQELILALKQLTHQLTQKQKNVQPEIGPLLKLLLEGKFQQLLTNAVAFRKLIDNVPPGLVDGELVSFFKELERITFHSTLMVRHIHEIEELAYQISELEQSFNPIHFHDSDVVANNILNSTVVASGNIRVVGAGAYNSRLQADKEVHVDGVFRGGEIYARQGVFVKELGSKGGSSTNIRVDSNAIVTVNLAYENSMVMLGSQVYRFDGIEKNVCLSLDREGNLTRKQ